MLVLVRSSANLHHAHQIWQLYNSIPLADMHGHIRFTICNKSLWFLAHKQCSNMSQRRVKVHCALWLLWKNVDVILHVLSLNYAQKSSHNNVQVTDLAERGQQLQSGVHGNLGFMKCLKWQFISPNLRYRQSLFYFLFRNFHWGALNISQLISQSKKHEKQKKTFMTTLPESSQIYGQLVPTMFGHQA